MDNNTTSLPPTSPRLRHDLQVETLPIGELKPFATNPRKHKKEQIRKIADSIEQFGFTNPILVDTGNSIIAGHGRLAAARLLNMPEVPVLRLSGLTEAQHRLLRIADNRLAERAEWDVGLLQAEFEQLCNLEINLDITVTGFEMGEIDLMLAKADDDLDEADDLPESDDTTEPVTRPGDLWFIGPHRLLCADATKPATFEHILDWGHADMVFTDPPYNVRINGHVGGSGRVKHREFAMASGEMTQDEFTGFLAKVFKNLASATHDGSIHFVCMDWRHMRETLAASEAVYSLQNLCVWVKTNGGMGSLYRSRHELVFVFKSGTASHVNNVKLGKHGRYRTNVWTYEGANSFRKNRDKDLASHPTVKPVKLVADAILDCSKRNAIVLDAFAGSGTTLLAAERTGRRGYGIEIDPQYCDLILRRMAAAGLSIILAATGELLTDVERRRAAIVPA